MTLDQYLTETNTTASTFAEKAGLSVATVSRLRRGKNRPDWATMDIILKAAGGKVTPNDFLSEA